MTHRAGSVQPALDEILLVRRPDRPFRREERGADRRLLPAGQVRHAREGGRRGALLLEQVRRHVAAGVGGPALYALHDLVELHRLELGGEALDRALRGLELLEDVGLERFALLQGLLRRGGAVGKERRGRRRDGAGRDSARGGTPRRHQPAFAPAAATAAERAALTEAAVERAPPRSQAHAGWEFDARRPDALRARHGRAARRARGARLHVFCHVNEFVTRHSASRLQTAAAQPPATQLLPFMGRPRSL